MVTLEQIWAESTRYWFGFDGVIKCSGKYEKRKDLVCIQIIRSFENRFNEDYLFKARDDMVHSISVDYVENFNMFYFGKAVTGNWPNVRYAQFYGDFNRREYEQFFENVIPKVDYTYQMHKDYYMGK